MKKPKVDFDSHILVDDVNILKLIYGGLPKNEMMQSVMQSLLLTDFRGRFDLDVKNKGGRYKVDVYKPVPVRNFRAALALSGVKIRDGLPKNTYELLFNLKIGRQAAGSCPELVYDLLMPKRIFEDEPDPAEILAKISRLSDFFKKSLISIIKENVPDYFSRKWFINSRLSEKSVFDRLMSMAFARMKHGFDLTEGAAVISKNENPGTFCDLYRDRIAGRAPSAYMRWIDVLIVSHNLGVSPHWVLDLDSTQPLLTENGWTDTLFGYYTVLSPCGKRRFEGIVRDILGDHQDEREVLFCESR